MHGRHVDADDQPDGHPDHAPRPPRPPTDAHRPPRTSTTPPAGAWQAEKLDRGLISVRSGSNNLVQWRLLGTEPASTGFNVYRGGTKIAGPITDSTNYLDAGASASATYTVRAVVNGAEQAASATSLTFGNGYLDVPIQKPSGDYVANDGSVGDLDGDGQLEVVLKWDPTNAKDNSQSGVTGNVYVDAYKLNGTRLWRIDLGRNIRAGAHYTQFQVYDYDGDGKAEVAMKTADGTRSGTGQVIGDANADYRNSSGYVLSGPEYFTVFTGQTGAIGATDELRPAPRHGVQLGRQLRQPGRPVPGRHRLPRRSAAVDHHGPRLLHACRRRGLGLPQRVADPAVDVRLEQHLRQQHLRRAGQPLAVGRRRRRRRQAGDPLRRRRHRRQRRRACGTTAPATGTPGTSAT